MTPKARLKMVTGILFWQENAKVAAIPNLQLFIVGFQKFLFFWAGMTFEAWNVVIEWAISFHIIPYEKKIVYLLFI